MICETPTGNTPTCEQANEWSLSVRPSSPAESEKSLCLPLGSSTLSDSGAMGAGRAKRHAQNQAARAAALRLPALELLLRAAGEGGGAHAQQRQRPAQQRRRAQQKSARAADGQRGKEHQRAEEQRVKPARGHLSLTGMRTAESTSANACSFV